MAELTAADLENLHKIVEEHFHLTLGTKERGILDAVANRPGQRAYGEEPFPDVYTKAASIMEGIIRWHPFVDGNKRTALVAVSAYLDINGYILIIPLSAVRSVPKFRKDERQMPTSILHLISNHFSRPS